MFLSVYEKEQTIICFLSVQTAIWNENLRSRTSNLDRTEIGATVLLVLTFFLGLLEKGIYETSQTTPENQLLKTVIVI